MNARLSLLREASARIRSSWLAMLAGHAGRRLLEGDIAPGERFIARALSALDVEFAEIFEIVDSEPAKAS